MDKRDCSDWIVAPDNLDEKWSCKTLGSLSKIETHSLLGLNPTTYTEAITYAKGNCFNFHFEILLDFLLAHENYTHPGLPHTDDGISSGEK